MIYLAAPYTHPDPSVQEARFHEVNTAMALLIEEGTMPLSPITIGHTVYPHIAEDSRDSHDFWMRACIAALTECQELVVLPLKGWRESKGMKHEIMVALALNLKVGIFTHMLPKADEQEVRDYFDDCLDELILSLKRDCIGTQHKLFGFMIDNTDPEKLLEGGLLLLECMEKKRADKHKVTPTNLVDLAEWMARQL